MAYHFVNTDTGEYFYCDDQVWLHALETARSNGWQPEGTRYDLIYSIDDEMEPSDGIMEYYYSSMIAYHEFQYWDGNYTDRCNQVMELEDTMDMLDALEGTDVDRELFDFIDKGGFRICSQ